VKRSLVAFLILIGALAVYAQPEKEVIGTWKMDASRSNFSGPRGAPNDVLIRFERNAGMLRETIKVINAVGESTRTINYAFDGAETVNGDGEERVKAKVVRHADAIILEWIDEGGTLTRTLRLSDDRRTLSINAHDTGADGKTDDLIVLQRQ
jgi:hypothetical protein